MSPLTSSFEFELAIMDISHDSGIFPVSMKLIVIIILSWNFSE